MEEKGTLYFLCGKMGAGKSTKAKQLATEKQAVLLSEDEWLSTLYPNQIHTSEDYRKHATLLKPLLESHVKQLLKLGMNVVMDFPANTKSSRAWFLKLAQDVGADHCLVYLNRSDEQCLRQIHKRRIMEPERAAFDTEEVFHHVTSFFEVPDCAEQLYIIEI
ncbi:MULTISPECIES: ATP-binding protein [unclassified Exiguobacterium]|uniref:AAA family ATPase n=1 Tax=unclassified Exiguobacterium TaxID=2644629 RepID=UPI001BEA4EDF|nr:MULTISPECIES: ATP-binding protein [unclassified Exiguobacterium]